MRDDTLTAIVMLVLVACFLIASGVYAVTDYRAKRGCLEHGWPEHSIAFPLTPYCIKRVNQTDTVVALAKINAR